MLKQHSIDSSKRKFVFFVGGSAVSIFFFVKSQDPKGTMKFEQTPDIPGVAFL